MTESTRTRIDDPARPSRGRMLLFRTLAGLALAAFAFALPQVLAPWLNHNFQGDALFSPWRDGVEGAVDAIGWVALLGLFLRPVARPLAAQYLLVVALIALIVLPAAGPAFLITLVLVLLPLAAYPRLHLLRDTASPDRDARSLVVAALSGAALIPLALAAWSATDADSATYAEHLAILAAAGLVACTRRRGWRWIAWPTAAAWGFLGVTAIAHPDLADSFGVVGGVAAVAVAAALAYCSATPSRSSKSERTRAASA